MDRTAGEIQPGISRLGATLAPLTFLEGGKQSERRDCRLPPRVTFVRVATTEARACSPLVSDRSNNGPDETFDVMGSFARSLLGEMRNHHASVVDFDLLFAPRTKLAHGNRDYCLHAASTPPTVAKPLHLIISSLWLEPKLINEFETLDFLFSSRPTRVTLPPNEDGGKIAMTNLARDLPLHPAAFAVRYGLPGFRDRKAAPGIAIRALNKKLEGVEVGGDRTGYHNLGRAHSFIKR